jgi:hypothetical protein
MNVSLPDIQRATGLSVRSVRRWISRLAISPEVIMGTTHLYRPDVIPEIQAAMIQSAAARVQAIREARSRQSLITTKEAKRRAGRRAI